MDSFLDNYIFPYTERYIGRARVTKDGLPVYTKQEEVFNSVSHALGVLIGIGMIVASILDGRSETGRLGGIIFGISLMILYLASSVYHGIPAEQVKWKKLFRIFDHSSIFILVAGTCTPFILAMAERKQSFYEWLFYGAMWTLAVGGIILLCINLKKYSSFTTLLYVVMGAVLVTRADTLAKSIGMDGIWLLVAGGAVYLIGLLFYGLGSRRAWMHSVFHVICLAGSVIHCICVCGFVI